MRMLFTASFLLAGIAARPLLAAPVSTDYHAEISPDIIVTAASQPPATASAPPTVLQGASLAQSLRQSLGETLAQLPGVSATSFGPAASRPVLRGLQGERVGLLTDGLASVDASALGADHAPAINPLLADRVEIVRGAEALPFTDSLTGGVVNVIDRRIPRHIPDEPIHIEGNVGYGSAAAERSAAGSVDVPVLGGLVVHADASKLQTGNMRIGGYALSAPLRAQALQSSTLPLPEQVGADGKPLDFAGNAAIRGSLPNSSARNWSAGAGAAFITDSGNLGVSYGHYDSLYGVPVRYATQPGEEQEAPRIHLVQDSFDARGEVDTGGVILQSVKARFGHTRYRHFELEEDGSIGTAIHSNGMEGRLDLVQATHGVWSGVTGAQFSTRDFDIEGDEAFLPPNNVNELTAFTLQRLDFDALRLSAGARFGHTTVQSQAGADTQFASGSRAFDTFSAALDASYAIGNFRIGVGASRSARAPAAEELFANGPHVGTQTYEIGNPAFRTERATGLNARIDGRGDGYNLSAAAYVDWYQDFIYQSPTGSSEDGLPVYRFAQGPARHYGFEVSGAADVWQLGATKIRLDAQADYTRIDITDVGPAPRIPPLRLLAGIGASSPKVDVHAEVERVSKQTHVAEFETPTPGYTMVNASVALRPWGKSRPLLLVLSANNIFDVDARRHASFLKDYAPLAGRDLRISAEFNF